MKKNFIFLSLILCNVAFSQTEINKESKLLLDTFKKAIDFKVSSYYNMEGDVIIKIDNNKWKEYWKDSIPKEIQRQRLSQKKPGTYLEVQ